MCKAVEGLSLGLTESDITAIASRHLEEHGMQIASWQSKVKMCLNYRTCHMPLNMFMEN